MTILEFINKLDEQEIDNDKACKLEKIYSSNIPPIISKIISFASESVFFDTYRALSFNEICEAEDELCVDFIGKEIIPVIDCGCNDFIVFHCKSNEWSKFNIVDECVFKKKNSLEELLLI